MRIADGRGRRVVAEIMIMTHGHRPAHPRGPHAPDPVDIATGRRLGMQLMDQALLTSSSSGDIDPNEAFLKATDKKEFSSSSPSPSLVKGLDLAPPPADARGGGLTVGPRPRVPRARGQPKRSDLHLVSGQTPCIRMTALLHRVRFRDLSHEDVEQILVEFMSERQVAELTRSSPSTSPTRSRGLGRFRVNAYRHAARPRRRDALHRPDRARRSRSWACRRVIRLQALQPKGLTLVTGPTGSGKSTTLAAMIDLINRLARGHIITIEDPIEFVHATSSAW